jgi:hypothetical protein
MGGIYFMQRLVDRLIHRVGYNLLVLALILKTMKDPLQEEYWELALEDFNSIVADDESSFQDKRVEAFGQPYPSTLSVAMLMAVEGLHDKARDLLYLVALFGGDGVPEPLLALAFTASHPKLLPGDFVRARDELEEHDLIQVEYDIHPIDRFTRRTCVLNPTRRLLIRKKKQEEVSAKLVALLNNTAFKEGNKDIDALVAILCLCYIVDFSATYTDENKFLTEEASKTMEEARKVLKLKPFTGESERLYYGLICRIEPFIHLLNLSKKGEGWEFECQELARKVCLLTFNVAMLIQLSIILFLVLPSHLILNHIYDYTLFMASYTYLEIDGDHILHNLIKYLWFKLLILNY